MLLVGATVRVGVDDDDPSQNRWWWWFWLFSRKYCFLISIKEDDAFSGEAAETGVDVALEGAAEVVTNPVVFPADRDG
jgi:hypothetical protein